MVVLALVFGIGAFYAATHVLVSRLKGMELEGATQAGQQTRAAMEYDTEQLRKLTRSYAEWNEAFKFAHGQDKAFMGRNFAPSFLQSIDVDLVWVLSPTGELLGSAATAGEDSDRLVPIARELTRRVLKILDNPAVARSVDATHRYVSANGALYNLGMARITRDDQSGDAGTLVFARRWDKVRMQSLSALVQRQVTVQPPLIGESPADPVHERSAEEFHVHVWLYQPDGQPAAVLNAEWKRDLVAAARRTTITAICVLVGGFLGLVLLVLLRLRRTEHEVIAHQGRLVAQARTDVLTGLHNRSILGDLRAAEPGATHGAVLYIDIDRFKMLNDSLGHAAGDTILRTVAKRLLAMVPHGDKVVRLGGDEFLVIAAGVASREDATQLARRIGEKFKEPIVVADTPVRVTLSIGAALCPADADTLEKAIRCADAALYHVKERGRNGYQLYDREMTRRQDESDSLRDALERAVREDRITVDYQPQYHTDTNELVGLEALARWDDPALGRVAPVHFIPLAEQTGLIDALGHRILRLVCSQLAQWRTRGLAVKPVCINLSARQFENPALVDDIRAVAREFDIEPQLLVFDIPESVLTNQSVLTTGALQQLRAQGYRIAIDDFGTGYSSLSHLRLKPVSTIKIDRSFIRDLLSEGGSNAVVNSILDIARHYGLNVVAEGVETQAQLDRLRELRCGAVQGFYLSKPVTAQECAALLPDPSRRGAAPASYLHRVK